MIILIDMDDTILWWGKYKDERLRTDYPHLSEFRYGELQTTWDLMEGLDEEHKAAMIALMDSPGFYAGFAAMDHVREALNAIVDEGHTVYIVTTPWNTNPTCMQDKFTWLNTHIGEGWGDRLILTRDKTVIHGDLLIDDKPKITGAMSPVWEHVLFNQPHNASVTGKRRLADWANWRNIVDGPPRFVVADETPRNRIVGRKLVSAGFRIPS